MWFTATCTASVGDQLVTSAPLTSKPIVPLVSVRVPVKLGVIVSPSTGVNDGALPASLTDSDQFCRSLIEPVNVTVNFAGSVPRSTLPSTVRPSLVL